MYLQRMKRCLPVYYMQQIYVDKDKKVNIERKERTCNICPLNQIGDENHYLSTCNNKNISEIRNKFIHKVKGICPQMTTFSTYNIMTYCISMKDEKIQEVTAKFVNSLIKQYKREDVLPPLQVICLRYMKILRRPQNQCRKTKKQNKKNN